MNKEHRESRGVQGIRAGRTRLTVAAFLASMYCSSLETSNSVLTKSSSSQRGEVQGGCFTYSFVLITGRGALSTGLGKSLPKPVMPSTDRDSVPLTLPNSLKSRLSTDGPRGPGTKDYN